MKKSILSLIFLAFLAAGCSKMAQAPTADDNLLPTVSTTPSTSDKPSTPPQATTQLTEPIMRGVSRVTKKSFGTHVTPKDSPVQPEKFSGYHTGIDFETTAEEQNTDVPIYAACNGKILLKKYAIGYGGVLVQSCKLNGSDVTIIYGHLKLASINSNVGNNLTAGDKIAVLGKGYSSETDGERKHLHFAIHKGTVVNILGYVQNKTELPGWLDAMEYLR